MVLNTYTTQWRDGVQKPFGVASKARNLFRNLAISSLSLIKHKKEEKFLRCIFCHYVFDDQKEAFEKILQKLQGLGSFIDTDTCIQLLTGEKPLEHAYFHLSFDDGFRNHYLNAFPILKRLKIPCIFFVPTSFIGANWDETRRYCLEITRYPNVIELLKWEDLKDMVAAGYQVGSHTRTHASFANMSHDNSLLEKEIAGSKNDIESKLDIKCKYISWPFGKKTDANLVSLEYTRKAGYTACFGAYRGSIIPLVTDKYNIPRHQFESQWPIQHIRYFAQGNHERVIL